MNGGRVAKRFALALAALVVGVVVLEVVLRATGLVVPHPRIFPGEREPKDNPHFVADAALGWTMRPDVRFTWTTEGRDVEYRADSRGRRVIGAAPDAGRRAIVVAGDSFAWGTGVTADETFAARVGAALGAPVVLVAEPGYGVDQIARAAIAALDELADGPSGAPAAVIAAIYPEDLERTRTAFRVKEAFAKPAFRVADGRLVPLTADDRPGALAGWIARESRVYAAIDDVLRRLALRSPTGERWEVNGRVLEDLNAACAARSVPLLLVHVPTKNWDAFPALAEFARARGIDCLDPLDLAEHAPEHAYFPTDLHLSAVGHSLFAGWIAERLRPRLAAGR